MSGHNRTPVLAALFLAAWLVHPAQARAQRAGTPFSSRAQFLAAPAAEVTERLGLRRIDPTEDLGTVVEAQMAGLRVAFGGIEPSVRWSSKDAGTSFHPAMGISLDSSQLRRLRQSTTLSSFNGVVRLVLAHEWAHSLFAAAYVASPLDSIHTRKMECHADLVAGAVLANFPTDPSTTPAEQAAQIDDYSSLAFTLGYPGWDSPTRHPNAPQRLRCIQSGFASGLLARVVKKYELSRDPAAKGLMDLFTETDRRWFRSTSPDTLTEWGLVTSTAIIDNLRPIQLPWSAFIDPVEDVGRMAKAAHDGPDTLIARMQRRMMPQASNCNLDRLSDRVRAMCSFRDNATVPIARSLYRQAIEIAQIYAKALGWSELPEVSDRVAPFKRFARRDDRAQMMIMLDIQTRTVSIIAESDR